MTAAELLRALEARKIPPLIFLYGEDSFSAERLAARICRAVVPDDARDFNFTQVYGRDVRAAAIVDVARTFPVFSAQRLILVKDAQQIAAAELDGLLPYLAEAVPETILIFLADKIDGRKKFFLEFKKRGALVEFKRPYDNQIPAMVKDMAREQGKGFTEEALALFCRRVGSDLQEIHGELVKLAAYLGEKNLIDTAEVEAVVSDTRSESVFDLTDALGRQDATRALRLIGRLLDDGTAPLLILSMMARHFRQLWRIRELLDQGKAKGDIQKEVGINPYFLDGLLGQSRQFPVGRYREVFEGLLECDLALKSAGAHPTAQLEALVLAIISGRRQ